MCVQSHLPFSTTTSLLYATLRTVLVAVSRMESPETCLTNVLKIVSLPGLAKTGDFLLLSTLYSLPSSGPVHPSSNALPALFNPRKFGLWTECVLHRPICSLATYPSILGWLIGRLGRIITHPISCLPTYHAAPEPGICGIVETSNIAIRHHSPKKGGIVSPGARVSRGI